VTRWPQHHPREIEEVLLARGADVEVWSATRIRRGGGVAFVGAAPRRSGHRQLDRLALDAIARYGGRASHYFVDALPSNYEAGC
jgi:hypothetical protein